MCAASAMTLRELNRATLARQGLLERRRGGAIATIERLCGMQAQELAPPFTGLWTRLAGFERAELDEALAAGEAVRATLMRATLHLVSAADYRRLRPALAPVLDGALRGRAAVTGDVDVEALLPVARRLLAGRPLTFAELRPLLAAEFPGVNERGLGYATRLALPLTVSPAGGFALAEVGEPLPRPELVRRYLAAFGPATVADMQAWSGLKGLAADFAAADLEQEGRLYDVPGAPRPDPDSPAPVRFLPAFDSVILGYRDRARVVPAEHQGRVTTKNLRVNAIFLVDGFAAGTWTSQRKAERATLTLEPFARLTKKARGELEREGDALLRFLEPDASAFAVT
jgi:hypothetical protein